jgi:hypothetical protein
MRPISRSSSDEHYKLEAGQYVLFAGAVRVLTTPAVALLIDTKLSVLITHGDPGSVRRELDEMREISRSTGTSHYEEDWLLLEGRPQLNALNNALQNSLDVNALKAGFSGAGEQEAFRITRQLLARLQRRIS